MAKFEPKEINNWEHDNAVVAKRTVSVLSQLQTLIDEAGSGITYVGEGAKGLETSADGWSVAKIDESSNPITIKHSIGAWDDRSSLTYT
jgi:predicted glutamine amidotransferase